MFITLIMIQMENFCMESFSCFYGSGIESFGSFCFVFIIL